MRAELPGLDFAPLAFLSALEGQGRRGAWWRWPRSSSSESRRRVSTGELNRVLRRALEARAPARTGARLRVLYATQADEAPPTFVLFVNDKRLFTRATLRYLENRLRADLPFEHVPLRIVLRDKRTPE